MQPLSTTRCPRIGTPISLIVAPAVEFSSADHPYYDVFMSYVEKGKGVLTAPLHATLKVCIIDSFFAKTSIDRDDLIFFLMCSLVYILDTHDRYRSI